MSTRAFVGYVAGNTIISAYSHYDGYPQGLGQVLASAYPTEAQAKQIIATRDIACDPEKNQINPFPSYDPDEGPMMADWTDFVLEVAHSDVQYVYLFLPGHGWVGTAPHSAWKARLREAKAKRTAIAQDKLHFQSIPRMIAKGM